MKSIINISILLIGITFFASCKKENPEPTVPAVEAGSLKVTLDHKWVNPNANFTLDAQYVHPLTNDTMVFTTFKYYISNIKLKKSDGTWWKHPESYFLVDLSNPSSSTLKLSEVPLGQYTDIEYTFGIDSLHNVSGAQSGALLIANNMFWSWNSGYIMLKAEGTSQNSSSGSFAFHLGGFNGTNNSVSSHAKEFNISLNIANAHQSEVHLLVYPNELWHNAESIALNPTIHMPGAKAKLMANDFATGIAFDHVHN